MIKAITSSITVGITDQEMEEIKSVAERRNRENRRAGQADGNILPDSLEIDIIGATGEFAVSKTLGLPWEGKFFRHSEWQEWKHEGTDVKGVEVRTTKHWSGRLILKKRDKDDAPYVLVTLKPNKARLVGWIFGREGKQDQYYQSLARPCYLIPRSRLRSMVELVEYLDEQQ